MPPLLHHPAALNNKLGSCSFETREDGAYVKYTLPGGADPVTKKLVSKYRVTMTISVRWAEEGMIPICLYPKGKGNPQTISFVVDNDKANPSSFANVCFHIPEAFTCTNGYIYIESIKIENIT